VRRPARGCARQLAQDALDVLRHGLGRDEEPVRDLFLFEPLCEKPEDLLLAWSQARRDGSGDRRRLSHEPPDAREEVIEPDRLRQVVVGAEQEAGDPVRLFGPRRGDEDDG